MSRRPVIGITSGPEIEDASYGKVHRYRVSSDYPLAVEAAGGTPIILPLRSPAIPALMDLVDGFLFSGGADLDPQLYGDESRHPKTYGVDAERDSFELELIRTALAADRPVLCICRGIQVLNVALGGTLIQHIPDQVENAFQHRQFHDNIPANQPAHEVRVTPGSRLEQVYGVSTIPANSLHHQSVNQIGEGLDIDGVTVDGVIEALSVTGATFALGVQWHPEMMQADHELQRRPFEALVAASSRVSLLSV